MKAAVHFKGLNFLALIFLVIFPGINIAQILPPDTLFTKTYGGSGIDLGTCIRQTNDGGYVITGYTRSYGTAAGRNILLIKTDPVGNPEWIKGFGGSGDDEGNCVRQTPDGGFVIAGYTKSYGSGGTDVFLMKTDSLGNELWNKPFGGAQDDEGYGLVITADGGFLIAGATSSSGAGSRDVFLVRTDPNGNLLWTKTHGGMSSDGARSIEPTSDGGYIISGWSMSYGGVLGNAWLVKTDSAGNMSWHKNFGGSDADRGMHAIQTSDGGCAFTGYTASSGAGLDDMYLVRTDGSGNELWVKTFGGTGRDYGNSIQQTADGGFLILGYTLSFGAGSEDFFLVKTDAAGNQLWYKTYGGSASDVGNSVGITADGSFLLLGYTLSYGAGVHDVWFIKLGTVIPVELTSFIAFEEGSDVIIKWTTASETNNRGFEIERSRKNMVENKSAGWKTVGFTEGIGTYAGETEYGFRDKNLLPGKYIYRLRQIDYNGEIAYSEEVEVEISQAGKLALYQNYPNPFNPVTMISFSVPVKTLVTLSVYDLLGKEIAVLLTEVKEPGEYDVQFNAEKLAAGVYYYTLISGDERLTQKLILLK